MLPRYRIFCTPDVNAIVQRIAKSRLELLGTLPGTAATFLPPATCHLPTATYNLLPAWQNKKCLVAVLPRYRIFCTPDVHAIVQRIAKSRLELLGSLPGPGRRVRPRSRAAELSAFGDRCAPTAVTLCFKAAGSPAT